MMIRLRFLLACALASLLGLAFGNAEAAVTLDLSYVDLNSPAYARYRSWVNAANVNNPPYGFTAADAAFMHRITTGTADARAQYCQMAVTLTDYHVTAAATAIAANQLPEIARDVYLEVGPMISALAMTYDWCAAIVTPAQRAHWADYAEQAVWNVWNHPQARWRETPASAYRPFPWNGWSVTNPGNNYHYSFVTATVYWAMASNSASWIDFLRTQKMGPLEAYYDLLDGGGSREGTGYGTAHRTLFPFYRAWEGATGEDLANANSHLSDTIRYWAHATVPTRERFVPFGDHSRDSSATLYDYQRHLVLEARELSADFSARSIASWWLNNISVDRMGSGFNYRHDLLPPGSGGSPPTALTYHAVGVGHAFARTSWDTDALWMSFSAGPFEESHAHQDQGAFNLYKGDWLVVSENIFSHSGINQSTRMQNLVRFERPNTSPLQCTGDPPNDPVVHQCQPTLSTLSITHAGADGSLHATANLSAAYAPPRPDIQTRYVQSWIREIEFDVDGLMVHDTFQASPGVSAIFQLNLPRPPVITGRTAKSGELTIRVIEPVDATLGAVSWNAVDPGEFSEGWRLDVRGSGNQFRVELSVVNETIFRNGFD